MRSHEGRRNRISMGALIAVTNEMTYTPAARRDRRLPSPVGLAGHEAWSRMSALERSLAADRDDPSFDYAAN